jgi:hypothetical protein
MSSRWRWIFVVMAATSLDLLARFGAAFSFARVMHIEAVLFPVTGAALATLFRYEPGTQGWPRTIRVALVWLFGLGGLRPVLWTVGVPLMAANITTLVVALTGMMIWWFRRRSRRSPTSA